MKTEETKIVNILMSNGQMLTMYAEDEAIENVMLHPKFERFKNDQNDCVLISIDAIDGFEVVSNRKNPPEEGEELKPKESEDEVG